MEKYFKRAILALVFVYSSLCIALPITISTIVIINGRNDITGFVIGGIAIFVGTGVALILRPWGR